MESHESQRADATDFFKAQQDAKPDKEPNALEGLRQQLVKAEQSGDQKQITSLQKQIKDLNPQAEQRFSFQVNQAGEKTSKAGDAATEKEYTYQRNKWDKDLGTYNSQREKLAGGHWIHPAEGAIGDALGAVKGASGLASGQGSGVRITQAELNSISKARGYGGDFQVALQKFGDGKNLDPKQEAGFGKPFSQTLGIRLHVRRESSIGCSMTCRMLQIPKPSAGLTRRRVTL